MDKKDIEKRVKSAIEMALADVAFDTRESSFSGVVEFHVSDGWSKVSRITIN